MFTVKGNTIMLNNTIEVFKNISCLRLSYPELDPKDYIVVFKNISCLRLRKKMVLEMEDLKNLKTFHVYG